MIYIYKDEKVIGKYYFQIIIEDLVTGKKKKYKRRGFSSETEARKAALKFSTSEKSKEANNIEFDFIIKEFLSFKSKRINDRSLQKAERIINLYIRPYVTGKYMNKYTALDAESFYDSIISLKKAPDYTNTIISQMKRLFKFAHDYYDLQNNPVNRLEYRKDQIKPISNQEVYTYEEFKKYIDVYNLLDNEYEMSVRLFFTVLFFTGVRRGEGKALRWNDIDFELKQIRIDEQAIDKDRNFKVVITKVLKNPQSYRTIPIDDVTLSMLYELRGSRMKELNFSSEDFIFRRNNNTKLPFADSTIFNRNKSASKKGKVKYLNIHGFRHSYASNLLSKGAPLTAVSEALGHSSIGVTEKVYTHAIKKDREKLAEKLNQLRL